MERWTLAVFWTVTSFLLRACGPALGLKDISQHLFTRCLGSCWSLLRLFNGASSAAYLMRRQMSWLFGLSGNTSVLNAEGTRFESQPGTPTDYATTASFHILSSTLFTIIKYDYEWLIDKHNEGSGVYILTVLLQGLLGGFDANCELH
jgi:hypothetical protein